MTQAPIIYIPHGGGPLPLLNEPGHHALVEHLKSLSTQFPQPDAILVVSAHWECDKANITSHSTPELFFDYSNFPAQAYQITYAAPGHPELATYVVEHLSAQGVEAREEPLRGWDHGVFVPLTLMYPRAEIPVVQLSLLSTLGAEEHIKMGEALADLTSQNILILGSGSSFHNMASFCLKPGYDREQGRNSSQQFNQWLKDTLCEGSLSHDELTAALREWKKAPNALDSHPRAEHLMPLMVCLGAAKNRDRASCLFDGEVLQHRMLSIGWI